MILSSIGAVSLNLVSEVCLFLSSLELQFLVYIIYISYYIIYICLSSNVLIPLNSFTFTKHMLSLASKFPTWILSLGHHVKK